MRSAVGRTDFRVTVRCMNKKIEWDELGFDPKKDGYWATAERIKERIAEKAKDRRRTTLALVGGSVLVFIIFSLVIWMML